MTFLPHKKKKKCPILVCVLVCVTHFVGLWDYTSRKKNMEGYTLVVFCLVIGCRLSVLTEMADVKGREGGRDENIHSRQHVPYDPFQKMGQRPNYLDSERGR